MKTNDESQRKKEMEQEISEAYAVKDKLEAETKVAKEENQKVTQKNVQSLNVQEEADKELKVLMDQFNKMDVNTLALK